MKITNRSNHMPRLMKIDRIQSHTVFRRAFCENNESGITQLHRSMIQAAHHHCPKTRFDQNSCSTGLPEYHPTKNSVRYAQPTTSDVNRHSFAPASRSFSVTYCFRFMK